MKNDMEEEVTKAVVVRPYIIEVTFANGKRAEVNVESELAGGIFSPLREASYFMQGTYDPEGGTIVWPNGADFSPEFFNERAFTAKQRLIHRGRQGQ